VVSSQAERRVKNFGTTIRSTFFLYFDAVTLNVYLCKWTISVLYTHITCYLIYYSFCTICVIFKCFHFKRYCSNILVVRLKFLHIFLCKFHCLSRSDKSLKIGQDLTKISQKKTKLHHLLWDTAYTVDYDCIQMAKDFARL